MGLPMMKLILSVVVALLLLALFQLCFYPRCIRSDWFDLLFAVAWAIGVMASGNRRAPDPIVVNLTLFIIFLAPVYLLASCVEVVHAEYLKRRRR